VTNRIKLPPGRKKPPARKQANPGHRNIAYLRVITALQDADNQKLGIVEYTCAEGLQPVEFIEETTSGETPINERKLQQVTTSACLRLALAAHLSGPCLYGCRRNTARLSSS